MSDCRRIAIQRVLFGALPLLLLGCGSGDVNTGDAVSVVEAFNGFEYYGPCGNEILLLEDSVLYPLLSVELAALDLDRYPTDPDELSEQGLVAPLRVGPPGPGDDVGTLLLYKDGMARFESDSGLVRWLSNEQRIYEWEC